MTEHRSSLAMALNDYRGMRPGIALTIAALALVAAMAVGITLVIMLGRSGGIIEQGRQTVRALHSYNAALEVWRQMAMDPSTGSPESRDLELRDSIATALRVNLRDLQARLSDPDDRELVDEVLNDLKRPHEGAEPVGLSGAGRGAMIVLTARQDSALFQAATRYQRSQFLAALLVSLTVVAAGVLIIPMSWVYVRYKKGIPPGL